ncbi:hypothetical protein ACTXT7_014161 [Hymenolepis weldensis]
MEISKDRYPRLRLLELSPSYPLMMGNKSLNLLNTSEIDVPILNTPRSYYPLGVPMCRFSQCELRVVRPSIFPQRIGIECRLQDFPIPCMKHERSDISEMNAVIFLHSTVCFMHKSVMKTVPISNA